MQKLPRHQHISHTEVRQLEVVGTGAFSEVRRGLYRGMQVAIKRFHRATPDKFLEVLINRYRALWPARRVVAIVCVAGAPQDRP